MNLIKSIVNFTIFNGKCLETCFKISYLPENKKLHIIEEIFFHKWLKNSEIYMETIITN